MMKHQFRFLRIVLHNSRQVQIISLFRNTNYSCRYLTFDLLFQSAALHVPAQLHMNDGVFLDLHFKRILQSQYLIHHHHSFCFLRLFPLHCINFYPQKQPIHSKIPFCFSKETNLILFLKSAAEVLHSPP